MRPKTFATGQKAENMFSDFLAKIGGEPEIIQGNHIEYDIICKKTFLTFEVKYDIMSSLTKNIAIEYHNSKQDKPSGIQATTANLWVHYIEKKPFIITVPNLKKFISETKPLKVIKSGGDDNADLLIFPIKESLHVFKDCNTITDIVSLFEFANT